MKKIIFPIAALATLLLTSCTKEQKASPTICPQQQASTMTAVNSPVSQHFGSLDLLAGNESLRKINSKGKCYGKGGNCAPSDIVIIAHVQNELDEMLRGGATKVKELFSNQQKALALVPQWNEAWFADVKTAILSGEYTFVKVGDNTYSTYLLGKEGQVSTENFDYALSYIIQP